MMKRSRSVFAPEMRPLFVDFEDAGMRGAMARLLPRLRECAPALDVPPWVWSLDFSFAVTECARCADDAAALVRQIRHATAALVASCDTKGPERAESGRTAPQTAAIARACFGQLLEALAASAAHSTC